MPSRRFHREFAGRVAEALGVDKRMARLGAETPDMDVEIPFLRHRGVSHSPLVSLLMIAIDAAFGVGYASHLFADKHPVIARFLDALLKEAIRSVR